MNYVITFFIIIYCGIYIISDRNDKTLNTVKTIKGIINDDNIFWMNYPFNIISLPKFKLVSWFSLPIEILKIFVLN